MRHRWPLNARELDRCIRVALALSGGGCIGVEHLPESVTRADPAAPAVPGLRPRPLSPADLQRRDQLATLLEENRGNVAAVARAVGKARMQVHRWVKRFDLSLADYR